MSNAAHNGSDDISFYQADIGHTHEMIVTSAGVMLPPEAVLPTGRYLIQAFNLLPLDGVCWIHFGPAGPNLALVAGQGRQRIPLTRETILAVETHVRRRHSDRVGAITTPGATCTVWVTHVSTPAGDK